MSGASEERVELAASILGTIAERDHPIGAMTTFRVGGNAALFVIVDGPRDLAKVSRAVAASGVDILVIGKGSNLLVSDSGFPGLAVMLGPEYGRVDISGTTVTAGGAASLPVVARQTAAAGIAGFEWAVGIPGSMGGGVRMNAGGHGAQLDQVLAGAWIVDLAEEDVPQYGVWRCSDDLGLGYRKSSLRTQEVVIAAKIELRPGRREECEQAITEVVGWRRANQPGGQNCGSVFANPSGGVSAGELIENAGLKGFRVGTAHVSSKHANFFQADPGGNAADVFSLMTRVAEIVGTETGVALVTEVRMVGF